MRALASLLALLISGCMTLEPSPESMQKQVEQGNMLNAMIDKGVQFLRVGDLNQAKAAFSVAQEIKPSAAALDGLGCVAMLRAEYSDAEQLFVSAYKLDPLYTRAIGNLALLYDLSSQYDLAQRFYEAALKLEPHNYQVRTNYAVLIEEMGRRIAKVQARNKLKKQRAVWAKQELLKAYALAEHPIIEHNKAILID